MVEEPVMPLGLVGVTRHRIVITKGDDVTKTIAVSVASTPTGSSGRTEREDQNLERCTTGVALTHPPTVSRHRGHPPSWERGGRRSLPARLRVVHAAPAHPWPSRSVSIRIGEIVSAARCVRAIVTDTEAFLYIWTGSQFLSQLSRSRRARTRCGPRQRPTAHS
jgi:hypothetical protein